MGYIDSKINDDCNDCKNSRFLIYINNLGPKIWLVEELSLILSSIKLLGFTKTQATIVAEELIRMNKKFKIFTGDKENSFKVLDKLIEHKLDVTIIKKTEDIFK